MAGRFSEVMEAMPERVGVPAPGSPRRVKRAWLEQERLWEAFVNLRGVLKVHGIGATKADQAVSRWLCVEQSDYVTAPMKFVRMVTDTLLAWLPDGARLMEAEEIRECLRLPTAAAWGRMERWRNRMDEYRPFETAEARDAWFCDAARRSLDKTCSDTETIQWVVRRLEIPTPEIDPGSFPSAESVTLLKQATESPEARARFTKEFYLPLVQRKMLAQGGLLSLAGESPDVEAMRKEMAK